jgi:DNA-binding response OmpR family regulator/signal transduction histidine kinase
MLEQRDSSRDVGKTALIIEDHPEQAGLVARILRTRAFEPIIAEDGKNGLRLARRHVPDVLLLDLMLPDINGFDICRQLRMDRETMLTPVVMLTALSDMQHRLHGFRVGANAYVTKPYGVEELFEAISTARAWRSSMQQRSLRGEVNVELNSEITLYKDVNDFLIHVGQATPLSSEQVMQLRAAVMEMAHNAIEWGNQHETDQLVHITYRILEDRLEIVVQDQRPDLDRTAEPHAAALGDPLSPLDVREKLGLRRRGLGLLIWQGIGGGVGIPFLKTDLAGALDRWVNVTRLDDEANELILIKCFSGACNSPAEEKSDTIRRRSGLASLGDCRVAVAAEDPQGFYPSRITLAMADGATTRMMAEWTAIVDASTTSLLLADDRAPATLGTKLITTPDAGAIVATIADHRVAPADRSPARPSRITSAIAEIVGGYCHDLRNSLGVLGLSASGPPDEVAGLLRVVHHAEEMVENLHRFARQFYRRAPESNEVGEDILTRVRAEGRLSRLPEGLGGVRPVDIELRTLGSETDFLIPAYLFDAIVVPLVTNAVEAISGSGRGCKVRVEIGRDSLERDLVIQVDDDGPGWPAPIAELREGLLRCRSFSTKAPGRGTGLLELDRLVRKLGGCLALEDGFFGGALVRVVLPAEVYDDRAC